MNVLEEFWYGNIESVVNMDGQKYVITYNSDTTYYLNEVEIDGDQNGIKVFFRPLDILVRKDPLLERINPHVHPPLGGLFFFMSDEPDANP